MKLEIFKLQKSDFVMKEVMDFERSFLMDKVQRREYEQREKALRDYYSYMGESYDDGYDKGYDEGKTEGKIEGKMESINEIALRMLKRGKDVNEIAEDTGLSLEEVQKLQA
jgi:predicted transposase/invertase (TIGR01784 family)